MDHRASGKTTLTKAIHAKLHIPYLSIDQLWVEAGGHLVPTSDEGGREKIRNDIRQQIEDFLLGERWVSDGWYGSLQTVIVGRADSVVFLDISLPRRLYNHLRRTFLRDCESRFTFWDDIWFTFRIIHRTFVHMPELRSFAATHADKVVTLRTYREVEKYLEGLK